MNRYAFIFCLIGFFACTQRSNVSHDEPCSDAVLRFNESAKRDFISHVALSKDLAVLPESHKCILNECISNRLDYLNNWRTTLVDSFAIRTYSISDIVMNFSFVQSNAGKSYFIFLPKFHNYYIGSSDYYDYNDDKLVLRDSLDLLVNKIDTQEIDDFFNNEVFIHTEVPDQLGEFRRLLPSLFPEIACFGDMSNGAFIERLQHEPERNRNYILSKIQPIFDRDTPGSDWRGTHLIFQYDSVGWFLFDVFRSSSSQSTLELDIYFIPRQIGEDIMFQIDWEEYPMCRPR